MTKLYAIAFGKDGTAGDSSFDAVSAVPATEKSTFKELLEAWTRVNQDELDNIFLDDRPAGFWLIRPKHLRAVEHSVGECHNDSAAYQQNRTAKEMVQQLAVRISLRNPTRQSRRSG